MNEGVALCIEVDPERIRRRLETRYLDEQADDVDDAINRCIAAKTERRALSVGLCGNAAEVVPELLRRGFEADIVTDQTSAHDPLVGYVPAGLSLEEAAELRERDPEEYINRARASAAAHCFAMVGFKDARRRGLRLRQQPAPRGPARRIRARLRLPGLRARLHPAAVLRGQGAVPLGGALRRPRRHRRHRPRGPGGVPRGRGAGALDPAWPRERIAFQGLPARICWLGYGERRRLGLRFNELVAQRRDQRADRDRARPPRLGLGRLALPRDRVDARRLRRDRRLAAPERARQHRVRRDLGVASTTAGAWGSGARSTPGWSASPTAPSSPREKLDRVLTADPGTGVMRHADAGYERALEVAAERGVRIPWPNPSDGPGRSASSATRCFASALARCRPRSSRRREVQRLIDDMIETKRARQRGRDRRPPGRRAAADRDRRGRAGQPALPLQAADPADRVRQSGDRAARRRARDRSTRAASRCPDLRGRASRATSTSASRYLDRDGVERDEVKRGLTAGTFQHEVDHLDGILFVDRARPADALDLGAVRALRPRGYFERSPSFVAGCGREPAAPVSPSTGVSSPGSAASGPSRGWWSRSRASGSRRSSAGVAAPPAGAERLAGLTLPGFANAHSHAFHRALRGRAQRGRGQLLDLARADVRARRPARPGELLPPRAGDLRRDGARRGHGRGRVPLPAPRPRRRAVRRPERDRRGADRGRRRGRGPDHAARRLLPARRHRRTAEPGAGALLRRHRRGLGRARRRRSPTGRGRGSAPRSTASARSTPPPARPWPRGRPSATAAARPRLRAAGRERGVHRRRYGNTPTAVLEARRRARARASPPCTPPTSPTPTRPRSARRPVAAACARRPSATWPTASGRRGRSPTPGASLPSAPTRMRRSTCSRRRARSSSTSASPAASAAATTPPSLLRRRDRGRARLPRLARRRARSSRARSPTWSRSGSTACASPATTPTTALEAAVFAAAAADVERVICGGREIVRDGGARGARRARAELRRVDRRGRSDDDDRDRPDRPPRHQRPRARRGAAGDRPRRGAGDRGRARASRSNPPAPSPTSASTPRGAA